MGMRNFFLLTDALAYMEANLTNPISQEEIASHCHCSLSTLQKLFRYSLHISIKEYLSKRRLTQAARALQGKGSRVTDIALLYQYQSPEVFSRAFARLWGITPTRFRREWRFSGLFPKVEGIMKGDDGMPRRNVDISELYDVLSQLSDTYALCFDIQGLMSINGIGHGAGDLAILECLKRIDSAAQEDMLLFRIGGDEFALVTRYGDEKQARALAERVLALNGQAIFHNNIRIPVSMYAGWARIQAGNLRYGELFTALFHSIDKQADGSAG